MLLGFGGWVVEVKILIREGWFIEHTKVQNLIEETFTFALPFGHMYRVSGV